VESEGPAQDKFRSEKVANNNSILICRFRLVKGNETVKTLLLKSRLECGPEHVVPGSSR